MSYTKDPSSLDLGTSDNLPMFFIKVKYQRIYPLLSHTTIYRFLLAFPSFGQLFMKMIVMVGMMHC